MIEVWAFPKRGVFEIKVVDKGEELVNSIYMSPEEAKKLRDDLSFLLKVEGIE